MKREGFVILEVLVAVVILSIITYAVGYSINGNLRALEKNEEYINALNLAQNYMNEAKYDLKYDENKKEGEYTYSEDGCSINTLVTRNEEYLDNYKIVVTVKSGNSSLELISYATKR